MRKMKWIALFLCMALLLPMAVACNGGNGNGNGTEGEGNGEGDGTSDFEGERLLINVSVSEYTEQTFSASDIYHRGPQTLDDAKGDSVKISVYNRNAEAKDRLGLNIEWSEMDLPVTKVTPFLKQWVQLNDDTTPDIFINDVSDLIYAMLTPGILHNLKTDYGTELNYLNFEDECWYTEYMNGTTITEDKMYVAVGDYNIDMLRFAFVIYINKGMFEDILGSDYGTLEEFYETYVIPGYWDYDTLAMSTYIAWRDTNQDGVANTETDARVGFVASQLLERAFSWTNGLAVIQWDAETGLPYIPEANSNLFSYCEEFRKFYNSEGIMLTNKDVLDSTMLFLDNNVLFALSMLGEMESEEVRNSEVDKGVVPMPKFDLEIQTEYNTLVHNQAEVCCIADTTKHFTAATAYLQLVNELSVPITADYFNNSLKLKYNDDPATQRMLDLIKDRIRVPFEQILTRIVISGNNLVGATTGTEFFNLIKDNAINDTSTFVSDYESNLSRWRGNLNILVEHFNQMY